MFTIDLASVLAKHGVEFSAAGAKRVHAAENRVEFDGVNWKKGLLDTRVTRSSLRTEFFNS
jgi:hypothetical protein